MELLGFSLSLWILSCPPLYNPLQYPIGTPGQHAHFPDTHIHASQYPNTGIFGKSTLLDWLQTYTFPLESSLSNPDKACAVYKRCVARTLAHGTTLAAYYATIDASSTNILSDICLAKGQRAFIGRCNMDSDIHPDYYRDESPTSAINATQQTIDHINTIDPTHKFLTPILTPRFAPSCTPHLLSSLGRLAHEQNLPIQTHISENPSECALVASRFPDQTHYAGVYDAHGLLTPRTVLAHAIHLRPEERALIRDRGAKISHCPVSNTYISSGMCPVKELLNAGIEVGLGTDVSGGWSPSVLVAAREAIGVSRNLAAVMKQSEEDRKGEQQNEGDSGVGQQATLASEDVKLSPEEALYMATLGGAKCLGLGDTIGTFEVGKSFDAQLVTCYNIFSQAADPKDAFPPNIPEEKEETVIADEQAARRKTKHESDGVDLNQNHPVEFWGKESWEEKVAKWIYCGDDRNTEAVWVQGKEVHRRR